MLVVTGTLADPHTNRIASKLRHRGIECLIVDYQESDSFEFYLDANGSFHFIFQGRLLGQPFILWNRSKLYLGSPFLPEAFTELISSEWRAFYGALIAVTDDGMLFNPMSIELRRCPFKPVQQYLAARAGFRVPETVITNNKEVAHRFASRFDNVVLKVLSGAMISHADRSSDSQSSGQTDPLMVPMTVSLSTRKIDEASERSFEACPHFFQQAIQKAHELRVVAVGDKIFSFRINSQDFALGRTDWRKAVGFVEFSKVEISDNLRECIFAYMAIAKLDSGSFDIIVDSSGNNWFLECNVEGAWAWLDDLVDGKISEAHVDVISDRISKRQT